MPRGDDPFDWLDLPPKSVIPALVVALWVLTLVVAFLAGAGKGWGLW